MKIDSTLNYIIYSPSIFIIIAGMREIIYIEYFIAKANILRYMHEFDVLSCNSEKIMLPERNAYTK